MTNSARNDDFRSVTACYLHLCIYGDFGSLKYIHIGVQNTETSDLEMSILGLLEKLSNNM